MSNTSRIPICVTVAPTLISRVDAIAEADERSRSYVVSKALEQFCDALEPAGLPNPAMAAAVPSSDAHAAASSPPGVFLPLAPQPAALCGDAARAAEAPGGVSSFPDPAPHGSTCAPVGRRASEVVDPGPAAASCPPLNLHRAAVRRVSAVAKAREAEAEEHRVRVERETIQAMKGIDE
jgi:hypothetical protein